jgi:enamine deaminase RidA (YjgF/YER057c/UK114 family)
VTPVAAGALFNHLQSEIWPDNRRSFWSGALPRRSMSEFSDMGEVECDHRQLGDQHGTLFAVACGVIAARRKRVCLSAPPDASPNCRAAVRYHVACGVTPVSWGREPLRNHMKRSHLNPETLPDWGSLFSQVVTAEVGGATLVYISGQAGVDADENLTGDGGFRAQTDQAFRNLGAALAAAGGAFADITALVIYVVSYEPEKASIIGEAMRASFPPDRLPALSLIGVATLARPEFLLEVQGQAVVAAEEAGKA